MKTGTLNTKRKRKRKKELQSSAIIAGCKSASCLGGQRWPTVSGGPSCFCARWSFPAAPPLQRRASREKRQQQRTVLLVRREAARQRGSRFAVFKGVIIAAASCCFCRSFAAHVCAARLNIPSAFKRTSLLLQNALQVRSRLIFTSRIETTNKKSAGRRKRNKQNSYKTWKQTKMSWAGFYLNGSGQEKKPRTTQQRKKSIF